MNNLPSLLAELDARSAGRLTGALFWLLLLGGGIVKCVAISRRPGTNTKCALGLALLLSSWATGAASVLMRTLLEPGSVTAVTCIAVAAVLMLGLLVASLVLAILGLVEVRRQPEVFRQGRAQAVWTLGLSGLLLLGGLGTAVSASRRWAGVGGIDRTTQPGQVLTFEELNFRFRAPERPWVSYDAKKLDPAIQLGFLRRSPQIVFNVIAERIGADAEMSTTSLVEIGEAHLRSAATALRILGENPFNVHGLDGILVDSEATIRGQTSRCAHWFCVTNGFAYQLAGSGPQAEGPRIASAFRELLSRFELIDPARRAQVAGASFAGDFASPLHGYRVAVTHGGWSRFEDLAKEFPEAEFGACAYPVYFAIVPVWLGTELEPEALAAGLLSTMNIEHADPALRRRQEVNAGALRGADYDFQRTVERQEFTYRLRVVQGGGFGYLLAAWAPRGAQQTEAKFDAVPRLVTFLPPSTNPPARSEFSERDLRTQGEVLNQAGLFHYRAGAHDRALALFRAAAAADDDPAYARNALHAWRDTGRNEEALAFLEPRLRKQPDRAELEAYQAFFLARAGRATEALTNYARVFGGSYRDPDFLADYVRLLNQADQSDTALAVLDHYLQSEDTAAIRLLQAEVYRRRKDTAGAIELLKQQRVKAPSDPAVGTRLVETYLEAGQAAEALPVADDLVKAHPDSAYVQYLKARSEYDLKWYREAKVSLERAQRASPADTEIKRFLDHVAGLLGEGNNLLVKDPIPLVPLPAALTNAAPEKLPARFGHEHGAFYLWRMAAIAYEPGHEYRATDYLLVKVLDASGVSQFSTLQFGFDPLAEALFVNEVRVLDAAGQEIATGKVEDDYVLDGPDNGLANQKKVLNVPVPGLKPGGMLRVAITRRLLGPVKEFPFLEHPFARAFPVWQSTLFLAGKLDGLRCVTSPAIEPRSWGEGWAWTVSDPPLARYEPLQPPAATFLPTLWMDDAGTTWSSAVSNYLATIQESLRPDDAIRESARQLVAGMDRVDDRLAAIARHVQSNYTYKGIEFGRRAQVPNPPAAIVRNRYGDCKDHAVLLREMLAAVGIPSQLALVNTRGPIRPELASLDQFDHMIVFAPTAGGGVFLDATDKGADLAHSLPVSLAGAQALILEAAEPRLASIPAYAENASIIEVQREVRLPNDTDIRGNETLTFRGVHAGWWRAALLRVSPTQRRLVLQQQMGLPEAEFLDVAVEGLENTALPLKLRFAYSLARRFRPDARGIAGTVRASLDRGQLLAEPSPQRASPFELKVPLTYRATVTVLAPDGYRPTPPGEAKSKLDPRFATCTVRSRADASAFHLAFDLQRQTGRFGAEDYPAYRGTMDAALALLEPEISFVPCTAAGSAKAGP